MTTIAYKDGIIAYDSRATAGDFIIDDDFDKKLEYEGATFFLAGSLTDFAKFAECFVHEYKVPKNTNCVALVIYDGALWKAAVDADGMWKHKIEVSKHYAIGNGDQIAVAAMDLGQSAEDAIKAASARDTKTGGKIRVFKIEGLVNEQKRVINKKGRDHQGDDLGSTSEKPRNNRNRSGKNTG